MNFLDKLDEGTKKFLLYFALFTFFILWNVELLKVAIEAGTNRAIYCGFYEICEISIDLYGLQIIYLIFIVESIIIFMVFSTIGVRIYELHFREYFKEKK